MNRLHELSRKYYITTQVNAYLSNIERHLGTERAADEAEQFLEELDYFAFSLMKIPEGAERALAAIKHVDTYINEFKKKNPSFKHVSCKKGCFECCRQFVSCTPSEGTVMWDFINNRVKEGLPRWERAEKQKGLFDEDFNTNLLGEDNKCMFLDDAGLCMVYPVRPLACRVHFVTSLPELCDMRDTSGKLQKFLIVRAEAVICAMLNLECRTTEQHMRSLPCYMLEKRG